MKDQSTNRFWYGVGLTALAAVVSIAFGEIGLNVGYWPGPGYGDEAMKYIVYAATLFVPVIFYVCHFLRMKKFYHKNPGTLKKENPIVPAAASAIFLAAVYIVIPIFSLTVFFSNNFSGFLWFLIPAWLVTSFASLVSYKLFGYLG